jgi:choice-of-anchor B domain-containing protein
MLRYCLIACCLWPLISPAQTQLQLLAHVAMDTVSLAGCWHHVDSSGREYALVGHSKGLSIIDVSNPTAAFQRFNVPGLPNNWREVRTWAGFAYVGSEASGSGITIIDLQYLPDTIYWKVWYGDGQYENQVQRSHTVQTADGFLYIFGGGNVTNGATIADLSDPWNPQIVGKYTNAYIHDGFIRGDTLWASEIYDGRFQVIDISDKSNPIPLISHPTPYAFNHNSGLSDNNQVLFTTDEKTNAPLASFKVDDLENITLLDTYRPSLKPDREVHNVRVLGDYLICPSYGGQLSVVDATRPENLIETGIDSLGNALVWDADPYLPSGILFATFKNNGFRIYQPNFQHACWLEGQVRDAVSGAPISTAFLEISDLPLLDSTRTNGQFKTGHRLAGSYQLKVSKPGYQTKWINPVALSYGEVTVLDILLEPTLTAVTEEMLEAISVFPTVFQDNIHVSIPPEIQAEIQLTDAHGRLIKTQEMRHTQTGMVVPKGIPDGVYTLSVLQGGRPLKVFKLLKL